MASNISKGILRISKKVPDSAHYTLEFSKDHLKAVENYIHDKHKELLFKKVENSEGHSEFLARKDLFSVGAAGEITALCKGIGLKWDGKFPGSD